MDISKEYIYMNRQLMDHTIQVHHGFETGDHWAHNDKVGIDDGNEYPAPQGAGTIWLPKQDQLQIILFYTEGITWVNPLFMADQLMGFVDGKKDGDFYTMEQLWLAFVMKEKYEKTWYGKKWV